MNYIDFFTQIGVDVVVVDEEGVKKFNPPVIKKQNRREAIKESFVALRRFLSEGEEEIWHGVTCGDQMLDFNIFDGDVFGKEGHVHCQVVLCEWKGDNWYMTDKAETLWTINKNKLGSN